MSMSVRCDGCGLEYAGSKGIGGLFAQRVELPGPRYLAMLAQVKYFHRRARAVLDERRRRADPAGVPRPPAGSPRTSPTTSCCRWCRPSGRAGSTAPAATRPATCSPSWTITACSPSPVHRSGGPSSAARGTTSSGRPRTSSAVNTATPIRSITRHADGVRDPGRRRPAAPRRSGRRRRPIPTRRCACWPIRPPTSRRLLSAFEYLPSTTLLHTDALGAAPQPGRAGVLELPDGQLRVRRQAGQDQLRPEDAAADHR